MLVHCQQNPPFVDVLKARFGGPFSFGAQVAAIYSDNDQAAAMTAANAAADGTKEQAFLGTWQTRLGTHPTLNLYREGTLVWSATVDGLLPISGSAFVVPTDAVPVSISAADIDAGTWQFRIENAANADIYIGAGVTKAGDTDVLALSDDLTADGSVTLGSIVFNAPTLDTATAAIGVSDPRVVVWVDANYTFATQPTNVGLQIKDGYSANIRSLSEPGLIGTGSEYTLSRESDPYTEGPMFRHRIKSTFPTWQSTQRSQYRNEGILDDTIYWLCHEFTIESDWSTVGYGDWRDGFGLGDIHHNSWTVGPYGVLPYQRAPLEFGVAGTTPSYSISAWGNYVAGSGGGTQTSLYSSGTVTAGQIHRFVFRFRVTRSLSAGPFVQIWRQVNAGAETQIVDRSGIPIGFADMVANGCYLKAGLYGWDAGAPQRTTYTKGVILLREETGNPTITAAEMFTLLRSL